jgi:hypothetical protein
MFTAIFVPRKALCFSNIEGHGTSAFVYIKSEIVMPPEAKKRGGCGNLAALQSLGNI